MPTAYRVLGQSSPAATTNTTLYTVPAATEAVVSSIVVCTRDAGAQTFRIAVRPAGAALANQHYIAYDIALYPGLAQTMTLGLTLAATDVVTVWASSGTLSFSAFGSELT